MKCKIYYDGGFLTELTEFDTEEELIEEAELYVESKIADWEADGVDYDKELFECIIE